MRGRSPERCSRRQLCHPRRRPAVLAGRGPAAGPALLAQTEQLARVIAPELPAPVLTRALIAWTQLFGMISFELFGHLVGSVDPSDAFFDHATEQMADFVGLPWTAGDGEIFGRNVQ